MQRISCSWNHGKSPIYLYNVLSSEVFRLFIGMPTFWGALFSVNVEMRIAVSRAHWFGRDFVSWSQNQVEFMFYNSTMSEEFLMWMPSDHTAKYVSLLKHWDKPFFFLMCFNIQRNQNLISSNRNFWFWNLSLISCNNESHEHFLFIVCLLQACFNVLEYDVITPEL